MFTHITWKEFAIIAGIIIFIYYLLLFLILNSNHIVQQLRKIGNGGILLEFQDELRVKENGAKISTDPEISDFFDIVNDLQNEIKDTLKEAVLKKCIREEIILLIQAVLRKYNSLKLSPFVNAINNYIATECQKKCSIYLDVQDINQLWIR